MRGAKKSPRKTSVARARGAGRTFDVINPATGKVVGTYPITSRAQVRTVVERAREAFRGWAKKDPEDRGVFLAHFAEILRKHKDDYATTMTHEMGKVIREANAEVEKCAWAADYFAQNGPKLLEPEVVSTEDRKSTRLNSSHPSI